MTRPEQEAQLLDDIASNLRAEGYDVYVRPRQEVLPAFMAGIRIDAVAFGKPKNLAIALVVSGATPNGSLDALRSRLEGESDWDLRVFLVRPGADSKAVALTSGSAIRTSLDTVKRLHSEGLSPPALLMAWATFEGLARSQSPSVFSRPQTPGRLVELLAGEGRVTPTEADLLRRLANTRNALVHGDLETTVSGADIESFIAILEHLFGPQSQEAA